MTADAVILSDAEAAQRRAADPEASVWVAASAGTGKTKVLTDRVLSLMLTGTRPQHILCLTFTRAAAAEMSNRIAEVLGAWATADDEELEKILVRHLGREPDDDIRRRARRLFAQVLAERVGVPRVDGMVFAGRRFGQTVARRGTGVDEFFDAAGMTRALQHKNRSLNIGRHVFPGLFDGGHDIADAGEVKHIPGPLEEWMARLAGTDVGVFENHLRVVGVVGQVGFAPAVEVIDDMDPVSALHQKVDHVAADETGAPGHHGDGFSSHFAPIACMVLTL